MGRVVCALREHTTPRVSAAEILAAEILATDLRLLYDPLGLTENAKDRGVTVEIGIAADRSNLTIAEKAP